MQGSNLQGSILVTTRHPRGVLLATGHTVLTSNIQPAQVHCTWQQRSHPAAPVHNTTVMWSAEPDRLRIKG